MDTKRFRFVFKSQDGFQKRTVYSTCIEAELQARKEEWAVIIEEEIGVPVVCQEIKAVEKDRSE